VKKQKSLFAPYIFIPLLFLLMGHLDMKPWCGELADKLTTSWGKNYGWVLLWIKMQLTFAVIWATNLSLHELHVCWQSGTIVDDGAGLYTVILDPFWSLCHCVNTSYLLNLQLILSQLCIGSHLNNNIIASYTKSNYKTILIIITSYI